MSKNHNSDSSEIGIVGEFLQELVDLQEKVTNATEEEVKNLIQLTNKQIQKIINEKDSNGTFEFNQRDLLEALKTAKTKQDIEKITPELDKMIRSLQKIGIIFQKK